jgi:hypothetical protein
VLRKIHRKCYEKIFSLFLAKKINNYLGIITKITDKRQFFDLLIFLFFFFKGNIKSTRTKIEHFIPYICDYVLICS